MTVKELYDRLFDLIEEGLENNIVMINHEMCSDDNSTIDKNGFEVVLMDKSSINAGMSDYYLDTEENGYKDNPDYAKVLLIHCK